MLGQPSADPEEKRAPARDITCQTEQGEKCLTPNTPNREEPLRTARRTLAGYVEMAMIRKGQVHNIDGRDMQAQRIFVAGLFNVAD
jgi:hypothetical protein